MTAVDTAAAQPSGMSRSDALNLLVEHTPYGTDDADRTSCAVSAIVAAFEFGRAAAPVAQPSAEPDGTLHDDDYFTWKTGRQPKDGDYGYVGWRRDFYLSAPAGAGEPTDDPAIPYTYASTQATNCACCGEYKHTPLRVDLMDGYVCLTCIDKRLESLLESEAGEPTEPSARALEFAENMAKDAEQVLDALNALHAIREEKDQYNDGDEGNRAWEAIRADEDAAEQNLSDHLRGLRSGVYEFRKRAAKVGAGAGEQNGMPLYEHPAAALATPVTAVGGEPGQS